MTKCQTVTPGPYFLPFFSQEKCNEVNRIHAHSNPFVCAQMKKSFTIDGETRCHILTPVTRVKAVKGAVLKLSNLKTC